MIISENLIFCCLETFILNFFYMLYICYLEVIILMGSKVDNFLKF